jgi:hypothetical protein
MLRCAASFITATYEKVGLIPQDLRALPLAFLQICPRNGKCCIDKHRKIQNNRSLL